MKKYPILDKLEKADRKKMWLAAAAAAAVVVAPITLEQIEAGKTKNVQAAQVNPRPSFAKKDPFYIIDDDAKYPWKKSKAIWYKTKMSNLGKPTNPLPDRMARQKIPGTVGMTRGAKWVREMTEQHWDLWRNNAARRAMGKPEIELPNFPVPDAVPKSMYRTVGGVVVHSNPDWQPGPNHKARRAFERRDVWQYVPPKDSDVFTIPTVFEFTTKKKRLLTLRTLSFPTISENNRKVALAIKRFAKGVYGNERTSDQTTTVGL